MVRSIKLAVALSSLFCFVTTASADWPRFRGPNGTGIAESGAPTQFGETQNLKWQIALPGRGVSSPIVVGDKVFVTCYSGYGMGRGSSGNLEDLKRHLLCVDRNSGATLWDKTIPAKMPEDPYGGMGIPSHGYASHTPVSDGEHVFAFFGKSGVYAFDLDGNDLWNHSVGTDSGRQRWGSAASPVVFEDYVIVNASDEAESIIWLDKKTGEEKHRAQAGGLASSWCTPALVKNEQGTELVISVPGEIWGLNASTGKLRWFSKGTSDRNAQISILAGDGIVYLMGGRGGEAVAVKTGGKGDVNETNIVWEGRARGSYATPLLHDGHLFSVNGSVIACHNAESGERVYQKRLTSGESVADDAGGGGRRGGGGRGGFGGGFGGRGGGGDYASPVLADGKLYITTGDGKVYVVAAKPEYELLATNDMGFDSSGFGGTPALSDGQLFMRSNTHMYCMAE